jgi:hypothetical protein
MIATARKEGVPALEFDDFRGDLTFLTSIFHGGSQSVPIVVKGQGADLSLLLLGVQMGIGEGYLVNHSPEARVALLQSMQYTPGGGGKPLPDVGTADPEFLRRMLALPRATKEKPLGAIPAGLTDVRLYRIGVCNAQIGMHLMP